MQEMERSTNGLENFDAEVVEGFGKEWAAFDQSGVSRQELRQAFEKYFAIFPASALNTQVVGFNARVRQWPVGFFCGSFGQRTPLCGRERGSS